MSADQKTKEMNQADLDNVHKDFTPALTVDAMDAEQKALVAELQDAVAAAGHPKPTDGRAMRFLKIQNWDKAKATKAYLDMLAWREENKVDELRNKPPNPLMERIVPAAIQGYDKNGVPLYIEKTGKIAGLEMLSYVSKEEFEEAHTWGMEKLHQMMEESSKKHGKEIGTFNIILDVGGLNLGIRNILWFLKAATDLEAKYYPEEVERVFLVNPPWIVPGLWELVKGFLHPNIQKRVIFLGANATDELLKYFDKDQLPKEYGGTLEWPHPILSSEELAKYIKENVPEPKTLEQYVAAGSSFEAKLKVKKDEEIKWYFKVGDGYDVQFTLKAVLADGTEEVPVNIPDERVVVHRGSYTAPQDASITLKWDNSFSYIYGKYVKYAVELNGMEIGLAAQ